jgi:hypothetical protein
MDEQQPVANSEFVYRRIHPKFYKASAPVAVLYEAFRPSRSDSAGLSVLRASLAQPEDCLMGVDPAVAPTYAVARLSVRDLHRLGLAVQPDPVPGGPPGHAFIVDLSWDAYQADKTHRKLILFELAKLASADIVRQPGTP